MKLCTCYSHQFVKCRGQEGLPAGWKCADEFDRELLAKRDEEQRIFGEKHAVPFRGEIVTDPTPLTETELREMEQRCVDVTPGPLTVYKSKYDLTLGGHYILTPPSDPPVAYCMDRIDATFFAAARTDLPRAIQEIRRLKAETQPSARLLADFDALKATILAARLLMKNGEALEIVDDELRKAYELAKACQPHGAQTGGAG